MLLDMDQKVLMKTVADIEIKLLTCKSNFFWEILAKKYDEAEEKIKDFYKKKPIPQELQDALDKVRLQLVIKKGDLPHEDLLV